MKKILNDILKNRKYDLSQIILNNELTTEEYLELLKIIWNEQIPEVKVINNIDLYELLVKNEKKENLTILNDYKQELNSLIEDLDEENKETKDLLIKIYERTIKLTKHGVNFHDSFQQAFDGYIEFNELLALEKIRISSEEEQDFYLNSFCDKHIIDYIRTEFLEEKSRYLYSIMINQVYKLLKDGYDIEEISNKLGIENSQTKEIYEIIQENDEELDDSLVYSEEQLKEEIINYKNIFKIENIFNRFSLEEENFLIMYLHLYNKEKDFKEQIMDKLFLTAKEYDILLNKVVVALYTNFSMYMSLEYGILSNNMDYN